MTRRGPHAVALESPYRPLVLYVTDVALGGTVLLYTVEIDSAALLFTPTPSAYHGVPEGLSPYGTHAVV